MIFIIWEPDPIGAAPFMGSRYRRKVDVLGMIVSIIGAESWKHEVSFDILDATIISSNFWPPCQSLAATIGLPVDTLQRRVNFWISRGIVAESSSGGDSNDHLYTLVDSMSDAGKTANYIIGMLKNFDNMALDSIHNTLKMLCFDPAYKKSLQQLQRFLSSLAAEEKIELRDGNYYLKK
nr:hypothetical protein [Tanacetum cinerariifolium]